MCLTFLVSSLLGLKAPRRVVILLRVESHPASGIASDKLLFLLDFLDFVGLLDYWLFSQQVSYGLCYIDYFDLQLILILIYDEFLDIFKLCSRRLILTCIGQ
jgi:hypothetical protein